MKVTDNTEIKTFISHLRYDFLHFGDGDSSINKWNSKNIYFSFHILKNSIYFSLFLFLIFFFVFIIGMIFFEKLIFLLKTETKIILVT